jgi:translation initiation factor IF-2
LAGKVRVYELAKEFGLSNKDTLELCLSLGIGVKSHSSSLEEAQADRVRRKVEREGLAKPRGEAPAEEMTPSVSEAATPKSSAKSTLGEELGQGEQSLVESEKSLEPEETVQTPDSSAANGSSKSRGSSQAPTRAEPASPIQRSSSVISSKPTGGGSRQPGTAKPEVKPDKVPERSVGQETASQESGVQEATAHKGPRAGGSDAVSSSSVTTPRRPPVPLGPSGRPVPPPPPRRPAPPRPVGPSGRPIPPPPGGAPGRRRSPMTGGGQTGGERTSGRPGTGRFGAPSPPRSASSSRPGAFGRSGSIPAPGGAPGGFPPGGRGAPGRGRMPQRRPRRRRRQLEELEPTQVTVYTPSNAPVPDHEVIIERGATAQDVGPKLNRSAGDVIRFLMLQGEMVTATQPLSDEMIELFAAEIGAQVQLVDPGQEEEAALQARYLSEEPPDPSTLRPRPAVVTVMGHVDHGKTLLLDKIRHSDVIAHEAGGITQHIGAYQVNTPQGTLTFLDTPGHEAFTAMRARGARVTDIVVLVVAADDGVMPQTVEAINHAKAAQVPVVVAINKIDREDANPDRVMQQLAERGLVPEQWGGDTVCLQVSALTGQGIDELLEHLILLGEIMELKASPEGRARGVVIEASLDVGRGPVATVIVQSGTLRVGASVVAEAAWGRVKALIDDQGNQVKEALPSMPVAVLGLSEPPSAGDVLYEVPDLSVAREVGSSRARRQRVAGYAPMPTGLGATRLEDLFERIQSGERATLNLILKADVQGSLEAVTESLRKLEREDVHLSFVHRQVGGITESDVQLAIASQATIIGFNVRPDRRARELAAERNVDIRTYEIIYKLIEEVQAAMVGMLKPEIEEVVTGEAEVRAVFRVPRVGAVAGCMVRHGKITRGSKVRFLRDGVVIWRGTISSLKRFKEDVREVQEGFECGIGLSDFQNLEEGDVIETYEEREIARG